MGALWHKTNRGLVWFHRWAGIVLGLLFVTWFVSAVVLVYVPFPSLSNHDRLVNSEPIDGSRLTRGPQWAANAIPGVESLQLISVAGRPTYLAFRADAPPVALPADERPIPGLFTVQTAKVVAERFGHTPWLRVSGPIQYDQWIVHQRFDPYRPFYRVRLTDTDETDLYVSARTGQVLQRTRGTERAWNWCGAVLDWLYFTPLRQNWDAWNQTVWWLSLAGLLTSLAGTWLGIDRFVRIRARSPSKWSPFRGWMRWHHVLGLFASAIVLVWIFSGWLSMDHGRLFSMGKPTAEAAIRLQGIPLSEVVRDVPDAFLSRLEPASEIRFGAVAGRPFLSTRGGPQAASHILWLERGSPVTTAIPRSLLLAGLQAAWPQESLIEGAVTGPDFYATAESLDNAAVPFEVGGSRLRVYVDSVTGQLLVVMDASRRAYAWVYYALHTFKFPVLFVHSTLRATIEVVLLGFGLAFTCTGIVLGVQRLRKSVTSSVSNSLPAGDCPPRFARRSPR
ncbi:MAG TPA: PepSY domain-containing protein [Steroidobacteraceae bacterium]